MVLQQSLECSSSNYLLVGDLFGPLISSVVPHANILNSLYPLYHSSSPISVLLTSSLRSLCLVSISRAVMVSISMLGLSNETAAPHNHVNVDFGIWFHFVTVTNEHVALSQRSLGNNVTNPKAEKRWDVTKKQNKNALILTFNLTFISSQTVLFCF